MVRLHVGALLAIALLATAAAALDAVDAEDLAVHDEVDAKEPERAAETTKDKHASLDLDFADLAELTTVTSGLPEPLPVKGVAPPPIATHQKTSSQKTQSTPVEKVNITGLQPARLLRRLWDATVPGVFDIVNRTGRVEYDPTEKPDFSKPILRHQGRMIGVDFRQKFVDPTLYDHNAGKGRFATVVGLVRAKKDALEPPVDEGWARSVRLIERWYHVEILSLQNRCIFEHTEGLNDDVAQCVWHNLNATVGHLVKSKYKTGDAEFDKLFADNMGKVISATYSFCTVENANCTMAATHYRKHEIIYAEKQLEMQKAASNGVRTPTTLPQKPGPRPGRAK